jgi:hypothetical protein
MISSGFFLSPELLFLLERKDMNYKCKDHQNQQAPDDCKACAEQLKKYLARPFIAPLPKLP